MTVSEPTNRLHGVVAEPAMDRLKKQTQPLHIASEQALDARNRLATRAGYAEVLCVLADALLPVADAIAAHPGYRLVPDHAHRLAGDTLADDLAQLGVPAVAGPAPFKWNQPWSEAAMLGAMYVIEGSSLGGVHLSRMARGQLGDDLPTRYLDRYGSETGPLWKRFSAHVNATLTTDAAQVAAVAAATDVFGRVLEADRRVRTDPQDALAIAGR